MAARAKKSSKAAKKTPLAAMTTVRILSFGSGANGKAAKTKMSITRPSKTRSTTTVARLALMGTSSRRRRT